MNETEALLLARRIPRLITHEVRILGNGEYIIALLHHGKIAFIIWEADDLTRIPAPLRSKAYDHS